MQTSRIITVTTRRRSRSFQDDSPSTRPAVPPIDRQRRTGTISMQLAFLQVWSMLSHFLPTSLICYSRICTAQDDLGRERIDTLCGDAELRVDKGRSELVVSSRGDEPDPTRSFAWGGVGHVHRGHRYIPLLRWQHGPT